MKNIHGYSAFDNLYIQWMDQYKLQQLKPELEMQEMIKNQYSQSLRRGQPQEAEQEEAEKEPEARLSHVCWCNCCCICVLFAFYLLIGIVSPCI